jgi:two-component system phosphate regulon sensor histidine kinase PhoR
VTRLLYYGSFPAILTAAMVLAFFSYRSALRFERLGEETIFEGTLLVARERVERVEQLVIDSDNRLFHFIEIEHLEDVEAKWEDIEEISHLAQALVVLDESRRVVLYLSRGEIAQARWFRAVFRREIVNDLELGPHMVDRHKHLHGMYAGRYYLISYITRRFQDRQYTICISNDVDEVVQRTFPELLDDPRGTSLLNVVDHQGRIIFGQPLTGTGEYIVAHEFPTTFYRWRLQVTPLHAPELEARARQKLISDAVFIGMAFGIIVLGMIVFLYAAAKERKLSQLRSEFVSNVTHELKTPLSVIKMFSELLVMGKVGDEERRRGYFEAIHRESERLGTMIDNVLDFSRLERGKALYEKVEVDVGEVVTTAVEVFRLRLDRQAIELKMRIEPDLPTVLADRHALSLAVFNMIDNALKYAEGTREIRVHVTSSTDNVRICVEDDGPGLPTDELTRVFERFFRGAAATRGRQRGSGIGLSLVQSVARGHGGKAWVDSEPGRGARFTIELPALTS